MDIHEKQPTHDFDSQFCLAQDMSITAFADIFYELDPYGVIYLGHSTRRKTCAIYRDCASHILTMSSNHRRNITQKGQFPTISLVRKSSSMHSSSFLDISSIPGDCIEPRSGGNFSSFLRNTSNQL
jgi:hypothetical protein